MSSADLASEFPVPVRALRVTERADGSTRRHLAADGCEVLFVTVPRGIADLMHSHDTHNATLVVHGEVTVTTRAGEQTIGSGQWYETHPEEEHAVRFDEDSAFIEFRFTV